MTDLKDLREKIAKLVGQAENRLISSSEILQIVDALVKEIEKEQVSRAKIMEDYLEELSKTYQEISTLFELNNLFSSVVDPMEKLPDMAELLFQTISFGAIVVELKLPDENIYFERKLEVTEEAFEHAKQLVSGLKDEALLIEPSNGDRLLSNLLSVPIKGVASVWGRITLVEKRNQIFTAADRKILEATAQQLAAVCERKLRLKEEIEKERLKRELEIARQIQKRLLPMKPPNIFFAEINAYSEPAILVGGDYYDFVVRGEKLMVCVADVSGKGVPAAMLMTSLRSALRTLSVNQSNLSQLATQLNQTLCEDLEEDRFVTMVFCCLDRSGEMEIVNAGHNPVLIYRSGKTEVLTAHDLPLGILPGFEYRVERITLNPGDTVLLYTDGIIEARNEIKEEFGLDRLIHSFSSVAEHRAEEIAQKIREEIQKFVKNHPQHDDTTIAVVKYLGEKS